MTKILNIAVLGWFNYLNAGDDRIGEVLIKTLYPHNVRLLNTYNIHLLKTFDLIIFTAGTWHPRHHLARNFKEWYRNIKLPYMAVGLGVEKTTDINCIKNYKYFAENASFVLVRDKESGEALGETKKIKIGPDITWLDPLPIDKNYNINGNVLFNLRPQKKAKEIIDNFQDIEKNEHPYFYSLSPEDSKLALKLGFKNKNILDFDKLRVLNNVKLIYGMRFHSSVFAQQQAIPHFNLVYHEKVSNLCLNYKSYINISKDIVSVRQVNEFSKRLSDDLLRKEREQLLENRKDNIQKIDVLKKEFLSEVSKVSVNNYSNTIKYRSINKLIKWIH